MGEEKSFKKRHEKKFRLSKAQIDYFIENVGEFMDINENMNTSVISLYFDTPTCTLINKSIEKPKFKEKIRLRSYGLSDTNKDVYLEIKRKLNGIVYKRRITLKEDEAFKIINHEHIDNSNQLISEIIEFTNKFDILIPRYFIACERTSFRERNGDIRITIDKNLRYRTDTLNLHTSTEGKPILNNGEAILEIKFQESIPLWLTDILTKGKIYPSSFSKVGEAHKKELTVRN